MVRTSRQPRAASFAVLVASLVASTFACRSDRSPETAPPATASGRAPAADEPAKRPSSRPSRPSRAAAEERGSPPAEASGEPEKGRLAGITAAHNGVRAGLKIAPLEWSDELAAFAQKWADKLARGGCELRHRPRSGPDTQRYGENIYSMTGSTPTADQVVDTWAAERRSYNAKANRCKGVCGHYTQIVWRSSKRVGCGMAACGDTEVWVCNYDPPGNFLGQRPY